MTDEIDIPASACEPKPWWPTRPDESIPTEIKAYIKLNGTPHLWRGHTHTKPPPDSEIYYIGETALPKSHWARDRWAPCPCCSPKHPKFYKTVMSAWFPAEGVIRILGPRCFASINGQGHSDAMVRYRIEKQRAKDIAFLLSRLGSAGEAADMIEAALPTIITVDKVREALISRLDTARIKLWDQMRDGVLQVLIRPENGRDRDERLSRYAAVDGYRMIDPDHRNFQMHINTAVAALRLISYRRVDLKEHIDAMSDNERHKTAGMLNRSLKKAKEIFDEANDIRRFLSPTSIATMKNWGNYPGSPMPFYINLTNNSLHIGRSEHEVLRINIPHSFWNTLGPLPSVTEMEIAAE